MPAISDSLDAIPWALPLSQPGFRGTHGVILSPRHSDLFG